MFILLNCIIVFWRKEGKDNEGQNEGVLHPCVVPHLIHAVHGQG